MTSLVISIVALGISCVSLTWTIAAFHLTGPRIKVDITSSWVTPAGESSVKLRRRISLEECLAPRIGQRVLTLEVVNKGRMPIQVQSYGIETGTKRRAVSLEGASMGRGMPRMVAAHGNETFHVPMSFVFERIAADPKGRTKPAAARTLRLWLRLSNGRVKRTRRVKFPEMPDG